MSGEALNKAAALCSPHIVDLLLEYGAKLEYAATMHYAALAHRGQNDRTAMIRHLLDLGVDINGVFCEPSLRPLYGRGTPLNCAVNDENREAAELLLELGAAAVSPTQKPFWYEELLGHIKERKGASFLEDIETAAGKAKIKIQE